jgi:hypothetical protein
MEEIRRDLMEHGLRGGLMIGNAIRINITRILKKMDEIDKNPPETLTSLLDYIEYKYERMREIARRAFKGSLHLKKVLIIIDICHDGNIQAIESNTIGNQTPEERCGELSDMSKKISEEALDGGNIYESIEFFKYNMISVLSVTNMDSNRWEAIKNGAKQAGELAMKTRCVCNNNKTVANSKCKCGTAYCSKKCQKLDWARGHKDTCSAVDRSKEKKCAECENPNPGKTCSCRLVHYCDERCQKLHRKVHKDICKKTMAEATMVKTAMEKTAMAEATMEKTTMVKKRKKSKRQKSATAMVETTASAIVTSETAMVETALLEGLDAEIIKSFLEEVKKQEIFEKSKKYANEF